MTNVDFMAVDVFAEAPGGGNPLGVVFGADGWDKSAMQRFAAWTKFVETTFVLPPTIADASYRLRIFTPQREIPFAGHPVVGSAHAVLERGLVAARDGLLLQEGAAGLIPIRRDESQRLFVRMPEARRLPTDPDFSHRLERALHGTRPGRLPPALLEGGRRWWVVELADEAAVRTWTPDHDAISILAKTSDTLGLCVFARIQDARPRLVVRAFPAGVGIVEDPASGAANGLIAARLIHAEPDDPLSQGYEVSQGREIGHDACLCVHVDEDRTIWVGGRSHTITSGRLFWPARAPAVATAHAEALVS